jgi:hypothetical protein
MFVYAQFLTEAKAIAALEDYFATGEVDGSERPVIQRRRSVDGYRWCIVFLAY